MSIPRALQQDQISLRAMQLADLDAALSLTRAEGWPHTAEDWRLHFEQGTGWVACTPDGAVIATLLVWDYRDGLGRDGLAINGVDLNGVGTLGLIAVDKAWRGRGIGRQLMGVAIENTSSRVLRLMATAAGIKLYTACGFREVACVNQRQAIPVNVPVIPTPAGSLIRPAVEGDIAILCALDTPAFGAVRHNLIAELLRVGSGYVLETAGKVAGYCIIRPGGRGQWIGPLVAENQQQALCLLSHILSPMKEFTRIDVPHDAEELGAWLDAIGMTTVDQAVVMERGDGQQASSDFHVYALASQAFG